MSTGGRDREAAVWRQLAGAWDDPTIALVGPDLVEDALAALDEAVGEALDHEPDDEEHATVVASLAVALASRALDGFGVDVLPLDAREAATRNALGRAWARGFVRQLVANEGDADAREEQGR